MKTRPRMTIIIQMGPILGLARVFSIKIKQDNYKFFHPGHCIYYSFVG